MVSTNGIRLHVVESGEGRPLVLLHGLGWDHQLWKSVMAKFSDRYRVIAGDTRGHGYSDKPAGPYSIQQFSDDWHGALQALEVSGACLVGFSQGGMIAQTLALQHPGDVGALFLACTTCRSDPGVKEILEERIRQAKLAGPEAAARLAAKGIFAGAFAAANPGRIEEFVRRRAAMDQDALVAATRAAYDFDVAERLRTLSVPATVVYGAEDALTPPAVVKQLAAALPRGTVAVGVPAAGHMIPFEQPLQFENLLAAFLEQHYPANPRRGKP
jgi:pimeloyl-ACP methyl ester carboxylesterase